MGKSPEAQGKVFFLHHRTYLFWIPVAVIAVGLVSVLISLWLGKEEKSGGIPLDVVSRIQHEQALAQKEHADFLQTPAGRIWQEHPYWDRALCQKIAAGEVSPGMSKEQVREAVGGPAKVNPQEKGIWEEWIVEGKGKMFLKFENNLLVSIEKK